MKVKTSITLSSELLTKIDRSIGRKSSRSGFIELVLRRHFLERNRARLHARDLALINAAADRFNEEAVDVLSYQAGDE